MKKKSNGQNSHRAATKVVTAGRDPASYHGFVNPPVYHASTALYPSAEDFVARRGRYQYGRRGTPTTEALESALAELEGPLCAGVTLLPSGLAAISSALLAVVHSGDILVTGSAYQPTRNFCEQVLKRLGVTTTYFDPLIGGPIGELIRPNTRLVYLESPGSLSLEMQDTAAIAKITHDKGALVSMDNTWATPVSANAARSRRRRPVFVSMACAKDRTTSISGCVDCGRSTCALNGISNPASQSRAGSKRGRKFCACCTLLCRAIPDMRSGNAIFRARPDSSAWCLNRCRRKRSTPFSTSLSCSALAPLGAAMKASPFRSIVRRCAPQRNGRRAGRQCVSISGLRPWRIFAPILSGGSQRWQRRRIRRMGFAFLNPSCKITQLPPPSARARQNKDSAHRRRTRTLVRR